jgi:glycosyltransferase involved in cell wall biosynthesis
MRILYVAYPMLPVTASVPGGAEQALWTLELEMAARGHATAVAASDGSQVAGKLIVTGTAPTELDVFEQRKSEHEDAVVAEIVRARAAGEPYDLIHDEGGSFWQRAREIREPVLATLHLPKTYYWRRAFDAVSINVYFNCVSQSQLRSFVDAPHMLGVVTNGIHVSDFPPPTGERDDSLLWIGRICEEKAPHVAVEVARQVGSPLVLAGDVYRFSYHQSYFEREVWPRLDGSRIRRVQTPSFAEKVKLLSRARALLVTSSVEETSSLVAMEAMACGTPVIAFKRGALPEVVDDGVTGFLVDTAEEMVHAVPDIADIDPQACRRHVERNFAATRMADEYERMYQRVVESAAKSGSTAA